MITLLGMGNVLMGDDAFGPYVLAVLKARYEIDPEVEVLDIGTPGLDITPFLARPGRSVILVDTVRSDGAPGDMRRYTGQQIVAGRLHPRLSPHDPALAEALTMLEIEGMAPAEFLLLGSIPGDSGMRASLTPALQNAVEPMLDLVIEELISRGASIQKRAVAQQPDLWWEVPVEV